MRRATKSGRKGTAGRNVHGPDGFTRSTCSFHFPRPTAPRTKYAYSHRQAYRTTMTFPAYWPRPAPKNATEQRPEGRGKAERRAVMPRHGRGGHVDPAVVVAATAAPPPRQQRRSATCACTLCTEPPSGQASAPYCAACGGGRASRIECY